LAKNTCFRLNTYYGVWILFYIYFRTLVSVIVSSLSVLFFFWNKSHHTYKMQIIWYSIMPFSCYKKQIWSCFNNLQSLPLSLQTSYPSYSWLNSSLTLVLFIAFEKCRHVYTYNWSNLHYIYLLLTFAY
jgi:hypothetical protein